MSPRRFAVFCLVTTMTLVITSSMVSAADPGPFGSQAPLGTSAPLIVISAYRFHPRLITVRAGTAVVVINLDRLTIGRVHTVTADDGAFSTGPAKPIRAFFAPTIPGRYGYHCFFHPFMHGVLVVKRLLPLPSPA